MSTITIKNTIYNIHKQDNGELLLQPIKQIVINNLDDISQYNFCKSKIILCSINDKLFDKKKYKPVLNKIYHLINSGSKIIINTILNIETIEKEDSGFYYLDKIGISVQGVDANKCIYEIINQCIKNYIKLEMNIKLQNNYDILIDIVN